MTAIIAQYIHGKIHVLEEIFLPGSTLSRCASGLEERATLNLTEYQGHETEAQPLPIMVCVMPRRRALHCGPKRYNLIQEFSKPWAVSISINHPRAIRGQGPGQLGQCDPEERREPDRTYVPP